MSWKSIRLELARTPEFPGGSASRAYVIRLPVNDDGLIDEEAVKENTAMARVRRFWPNERDMSGYVIKTPKGWAFSYRVGEDDDETIFLLDRHVILPGKYITLTEPDGSQLPFRIATVQDLN